MTDKRAYHSLNVVTASGGAEKAIVTGGNAGGCFGGGVYSTTEIYDVSSATWSAGPSMSTSRMSHVSSDLNDGTVLVMGGQSSTSIANALLSTENYDPISNSWTSKDSMNIERGFGHKAVVLDDGKILVTGGLTSSSSATATVEIYDPSLDQWTLKQSMNTARYSHTATLLPNGDVLIVGGNGSPASTTAEVYDVSSNTWSSTPSLPNSHYLHTATLLNDGTVLVAGGWSTSNKAELYDYSSDTWTNTTNLNTGRREHTATLLNDGTVLVAGGTATDKKKSEYYTP